MTTFRSDLGQAQQRATTVKHATVQLTTPSASITTDNQTTISGNSNAYEVIQIAQNSAQQIAAAITLAVTSLQRVASDFEALDNELSRSFAGIGGIKP